jgi:hypothetical protein
MTAPRRIRTVFLTDLCRFDFCELVPHRSLRERAAWILQARIGHEKDLRRARVQEQPARSERTVRPLVGSSPRTICVEPIFAGFC